MEWYYYLPIIFLIIVTIAQALKPVTEEWKSQELVQKFQELGNLIGKSLSEIEDKAGIASIKQYANGGIICTWSSQNYVISLFFDNNEHFIYIIDEQEISMKNFY